MTSLTKQLKALSGPHNKVHSRFRREYASREHYNRIVVSECWDHMASLDASFLECQGLFRRCLASPGAAAVASMVARSSITEGMDSSDGDATTVVAVSEWEEKEVEFMHESEIAELERMLQLFLDLSTPWLLHDQCQRLVDFLIYQYELATRFGEVLVLALLPIHESLYYRKVTSLVSLPEGSDLWYYVPAKKVEGKVPTTDPGDTQGVSREFIVSGTVRSFSNYRRISETVERIVLLRNRGGTYVPLYTVLTLAFVEQNGKKLGDNETRLLLNNAFTGLKHPQHSAYYSAQLCALSVLFATISVTIPVQRSVVTALLNPLFCSILEASSPTFHMRLKVKDSILVLLGMFHQQKERLDVLPPETTRLLLRVFHQYPSMVNLFRGIGGSGDILDFSRLCKVLTLSVVKITKQRSVKASGSGESDAAPLDFISFTVDLFLRLDFSICYVRVMLLTLIDDLVMFSLSCQHGESLFEWDSATMTGSLNPNHRSTLSVYGLFMKKLYSSSPAVFEDVMRRVLESKSRSHEILPVFLLICYSVSDGCPLSFTVLVHKCLGRRLDSEKVVMPRSVAADNLGSTLLLYTDPHLGSTSRVELYKMLSSVMSGDVLSSVDYSLLREFVHVSISDHECCPHFHSDEVLLSKLPVSVVADVVTKHITSLIAGDALKFSAPVTLKMRNGYQVIDMSKFYDKCFEVLSVDSPATRQLMCALSMFCKFYAHSSGDERSSMHRASHHFMSLLRTVSSLQRSSRMATDQESTVDVASSDSSWRCDATVSPWSPTTCDFGDSGKSVNSTKAFKGLPSIAAICDSYFGNSNSSDLCDYESTMSLLISVLNFMMRISTASTYVSTSPVDSSEETPSGDAYFASKDSVWCNEWLVCYSLYRSSALLQASTKSSPPTSDAATSSTVSTSKQFRQLFALSEIILGYAVKLYRGSVLLADMTYMFARCHFKLLTLCTLSKPAINMDEADRTMVDGASSSSSPITIDYYVDRDILMLHTMLSLSSDDMTSDFKESLYVAPNSTTILHSALWLKHYFEFGRFIRNSEGRPGSRLDLYSKTDEGYVDVLASDFQVKTSDVVSYSLDPGLSLIAELLKGSIDLPNVPLPDPLVPECQSDTIRIPYTYLLDLDTHMKMYNRCMDIISHIVCELLRSKVLNNSCLLLDVMVNSFEFILDKELSIRRPAVSMLCNAMQTYVQIPFKAKVEFVSICGYRLSAGYAEATSGLEHSFKGIDKAMKQLCATLLGMNPSSPNSMFSSHLFTQCSRESVLPFALLYTYVSSGTSLQFNIDVLKAIIGALPSTRSIDAFGPSFVGILSRIKSYNMGSPSSLWDLLSFLLCFASLESSLFLADLQGSDVYFASSLCPALFESVALLFTRVAEESSSLREHVRTVRSLVSLCITIATSTLSGGLFWNLKGDIRVRFLASFDSVFSILDGASRHQCLKFITSGYKSDNIGMKPLVSTIDRLHDRSEHFMEQFLMGILSNASSDLLFEALNTMLHYDKLAKYGIQVPCLLMQRLVITIDLGSDEGLPMLSKGCASLFDGVLKSCKPTKSSVSTDVSPIDHLSHLSNFIIVLYRRICRALDRMSYKEVDCLHRNVCRCLNSLVQIYGSCIYDFVLPFLRCMCMVGAHLSSVVPAGTTSDDAASCPESHDMEPTVIGAGCAPICDVLMQVLESDKSVSTCLKFVNLAVVFTDDDPGNDRVKLPPRKDVGNTSRQKGVAGAGDISLIYDEWLCYSLYSCLWIAHLPRSSPAVLRCVELLKRSNDVCGILAKLLFTVIASTSVDESDYLREVPHLDVHAVVLGKQLDSSSNTELAHEVYAFIHDLVVSHPALFGVVINAESFNNLKSVEYRGYRSLSLLLQGTCLSLLCFKDVSGDLVISSLNKKKKGVMGMCTGGASVTSNECGRLILKHAKEIGHRIYDANPAENHPRLALGSLSFFGAIDRCLNVGNYWTDGCNIQLTRRPWICDYIVNALSFIAAGLGNKVTLSDRNGQDAKSAITTAFSKELSTVLGNLVRVLVDFLTATDSCISRKKADDDIEDLFMRSRKTVWRCLIGLCGRLPGPWVSPCFALASSRLEMLLHQKTLYQQLLLDFINSVKLCIRVVCSANVDIGTIELSAVRTLSSSLASFTAHMVQEQMDSTILSLFVVVLMLLLRSSFGRVTGDELLESILNMLIFYKSPEVHEERFSLPSAEDLLNDNHLVRLCRDIFEELLGCKSERLCSAATPLANEPEINFSKATCPRVLTLLSFYAGTTCKYQDLLKVVLALDFSKVVSTIRDSSRLLSIISINLYYNRIKPKHVSDLERIYFLNVNLMSEFEKGSLSLGNRKPRRSSKSKEASCDTTPSNEGATIGTAYLEADPTDCHLDLSCRLFSETRLEFGNDRGIKSFEDCVIAFALQYIAKIKSSDLVEFLANHMSILQKAENSAYNEFDGFSMDGTRLFLRVLIATLTEYGRVGATQFVVPRVYQFLNAVLNSTIIQLRDPSGKGGKSKKDKQHLANPHKSFVNAVLTLRSLRVCVETWDSKQSSVPEMFLNTILPTLGNALDVFNSLDDAWKMTEWERALEDLFFHLLVSCSSDADRVELVLSGDLVTRTTVCKCRILNILLSLWGKASFHLGGSVVNVMPMIGELVEDESVEVQRLAELLNEKIQSFLNAE